MTIFPQSVTVILLVSTLIVVKKPRTLKFLRKTGTIKKLRQTINNPLPFIIMIGQVSSMIHSVRPTVSPVANIVFALFCFARF